jgi:putative modified peptide
MSREAIERLMDRWATDADFRTEVREDPQGALARHGIELEQDELAALQSVDWSQSDQELQARVSKTSNFEG